MTALTTSTIADKIQHNIPLSTTKYNTFAIGGNAEMLVEVDNSIELEEAVRYAFDKHMPFTIIGGGSNILVSDNGIKGLVIKNNSRRVEIGGEAIQEIPQTPPRHTAIGDDYYSTEDLTYTDSGPRKEITFDAGVKTGYAINAAHRFGLTGLCHFSGIPGTLGGALYNNIHGADKHFSDYFVSAEILEVTGTEVTKKHVNFEYFKFGYDQSILRDSSASTKVVVLTVTLSLFEGDVEASKEYTKAWFQRKHTRQPWNSAGCVFQNLKPHEQELVQAPTPSWGYVTDKILHMKGETVGGAQISTQHASFIVNEDNATAHDVLELMKRIKRKFKELGVSLTPEINLIGFDKEEIQELFA